MVEARLVRVHEDTYNELISFGKYGDTMDDILKRIIKEAKRK